MIALPIFRCKWPRIPTPPRAPPERRVERKSARTAVRLTIADSMPFALLSPPNAFIRGPLDGALPRGPRGLSGEPRIKLGGGGARVFRVSCYSRDIQPNNGTCARARSISKTSTPPLLANATFWLFDELVRKKNDSFPFLLGRPFRIYHWKL